MGDNTFLLTESQALRRRTIVRMMAVALFAVSIGYVAISKPDGSITGRTSTSSAGCSCHNANPSTATTLAVTGTFSVEAGSTTTYTATVSHSSQTAAGINLGVKTTATGSTDAGTLAPAAGSGLQLNGTELTHTGPKTLTGGTASFSFTWAAPNTPGTYYFQAAGNAVNLDNTNGGDFWNWLTPVAITVNGIVLTSPNGGETWCPGTSQTVTWASTGVTNVKVEVSTNGTSWTTLVASTSASAGSWTWAIPAGQTPGTTYRIRVSDAANAARIDASDAPFTIGTTPSITTQPTAQTICQGQTATFSVVATGSNLTYQWRRNGTAIAGATSATYNIPNAPTTAAGTIDVQVTNSCGTTTSTGVQLTVNARPAITAQPTAQSACVFGTATFSVTATGADLTYQWKKNGVDIPGATTSTHTLGTVNASDSGLYSVVVGGSCTPSVTSNSVALTVNTVPSITINPAATQSLCVGDQLTLNVTATGSNLTYQWRRNGTAIDSARSATLTIPAITAAQGGNYDVIVSGSCTPRDTSNVSVVTVTTPPAITTQPTPQTALVGGSASFTVVATGTAPIYQWRKNGVPISGVASATLPLTNIQYSDSGVYEVRIMNRCDTVISDPVRLTVSEPGAGALLTLSQASVSFGSVPPGNMTEQTLTDLIRNSGDSTLNVTAMTITGGDAGDFAIVSGGAPFTLAPDEAHTVVLRFTPSTPGSKTATLEFTSNSVGTASLALEGSGSSGGFSVTPSALDFDSVTLGAGSTLPLVYCNTGSTPLVISEMTLPAGAFSIPASPVLPMTLGPGECDTVDVQFMPTAEGAASGELTIIAMNGSLGDTIRVPLSGIGAAAASVRDEPSAIGGATVSPNPGRGEATVTLSLLRAAHVEIMIVDAAGRTVRSHAEQVRSAGEWRWRWDGTGESGEVCPDGHYRILLHIGGKSTTLPLVLMR